MHGTRELRFHALSAGEHAFLTALKTHSPFATAVETAAEAAAVEFDPGAALRRFVLAAAIVDFH
jgi:hypothetical protein